MLPDPQNRIHRIPFSLIVGLVLLLICAVSSVWLLRQQRGADDWVRHTLEVENRVARIQTLTARAEINRRGYLINGSAASVVLYRAMRRAVLPELDALATAVRDNPPQEHRAEMLRSTIRLKLDEMQNTLALSASGHQGEAIAILAGKPSLTATSRLLALIAHIHDEEESLLKARKARAERLETFGLMTAVGSAVLILAIAALVGLELRRRIHALNAVNAELEEDIAKRKVMEVELKAAHTRAEAAGHAKTNFLANMSHEIRTPMNGVIGFTDILLSSGLTDAQHRYAELIADSGRAMMRLLNDVLDLSKVEAGQMSITTEPFDLPHALRGCGKLIVPAVEQRGLRFVCDLADDLPKIVLGDGLRLRQILLNLLGNAAKFTAQGEIRFSARAIKRGAETDISIVVEDTGIGIAPEHQHAIFDQFVQADNKIAGRFGGTGLGLAISAQLASLMGGELSVTSEVGQGARFTLTLPLKIATLTSELEVPEAVAQVSTEHAGPSGRAIRVLVAEDHDVNQLLIMAMLDQLGYRTDLAVDGAEAVAKASAANASDDPYAIVLMDMQMPNVDGCEASRQIRALSITPRTLPILALTANAYADDIALCLQSGMQAHLAKPLNKAELRAAIERWAAHTSEPKAEAAGAARFSPRLQERYAKRRAEMIAAIDDLAVKGDPSRQEIVKVLDLLHKFLGSAEMFGDARLAAEARLLERDFKSWPLAQRATRLRAAAKAMSEAA